MADVQPKWQSRQLRRSGDQPPGVVAVRDSKHREGPALIFTQDDWKDFLTQLHSSPAQG